MLLGFPIFSNYGRRVWSAEDWGWTTVDRGVWLQDQAHSVGRSLLLLTSMCQQVEECKLKNSNGERVEQEKNPQDNAGLLSFAFFWLSKFKIISPLFLFFKFVFLGGCTPC